MARRAASAKWAAGPALEGQRDMPLALRLSEGLGVGPQCVDQEVRQSARLLRMNARVDLLLDEALDLLPEERSAVAMALIDSLEGSDDRVISEAWRAELLQRREGLRSGTVKATPWVESRARMAGW